MSETELRTQVVIPVLRATAGVTSVTDVHGQNERGLDVIFFLESEIENLCYGLQLKKGNIGGGGTSKRTVKQIVDQLQLADDFEHPVAVTHVGEFRIDRFIVATSGTISTTAQQEIAKRVNKIPVSFWEGTEIIRRIHKYLPELLKVSDGATVQYIRTVTEEFDAEPALRRIFDPGLGKGTDTTVRALALMGENHNAVVVADQDGGKTAMLRMLGLRALRATLEGSKLALPIIVRAKEILTAGFSVEDALATELRRRKSPDLAETIEADLEAGNYFVCVDGFSEVTDITLKDLVHERITGFAERFPKVRIVVSARPHDFLQPKFFRDFYHYAIEPFSDQQSVALIRKWTGESAKFADVAANMVDRLREALQLPGSPIPATIGVMLHEEQNRYITNTAEAIERYMVIRLGRYAMELGMKQEVDWARKQDLLSEIAFDMVEADQDVIAVESFIIRVDELMLRQGDEPRGSRVLDELVDSGVLNLEGSTLNFFRSSFRDFFAAHHLRQRGDLDAFATDRLLQRRWGSVITFAAGLRRNNSRLLNQMSASVAAHKARAVDGVLGDDYFYSAYLSGRVLSNSESSDHAAKVAALRTTLEGVKDSVPELQQLATDQYGNIGILMAVFAAEHSFFVAIGVPWIRNQLLELMQATDLSDEERYFLASAYASLGYDDCHAVLRQAITESTSTRVLLVLQLLITRIVGRELKGKEADALRDLRSLVDKRLASRKEEVSSLVQIKQKALRVEMERMRRLENRERRKGGR
jgi:hypothetical protein